MSGTGQQRRTGTPATGMRAHFHRRWKSTDLLHHPGSEEKIPCCETYPLDTGTRDDDTPEAIKRFLHQIAPEPEPETHVDPSFQRHIHRGHLIERIRMSGDAPTGRTSRRSSLAADTGSPKGDEDSEGSKVIAPQKQHHKFTQMEIVTLWNKFKFDFPTGNINDKQLLQLFKQVFPRKLNAERIIDNIFMVFDPEEAGFISFRELLILFSMSMDGTPREKLHWAFKLYDQDGDELLNEEDMIDVFNRLWKLAENMDAAQKLGTVRRKPAKVIEEAPREPSPKPPTKNEVRQAGKLVKTGQKKKIWKAQQPVVPDKKLDIAIMSSKMSGRSVAGTKPGAKKPSKVKKAEVEITEVAPETETPVEEPESTDDKVDPVERALDIFHSLDIDSDGVVTEEEFVEGCLSDPNFLAVLQAFNCDFIWTA